MWQYSLLRKYEERAFPSLRGINVPHADENRYTVCPALAEPITAAAALKIAGGLMIRRLGGNGGGVAPETRVDTPDNDCPQAC